MLAATPPRSSQKSTMDSHLTTAMRKAGFEAAKKAVDVKSQSRALGESKGFEIIDQGGAERVANKPTTTGLKSSDDLETAKGGESQNIASAEQSSSEEEEEEDDELDEKKVEKKAVSELKTLPIRQKPQNLQGADEEDEEEGHEDEDGDEVQDEAESRSQTLSTSKPAGKAKKSNVDEDDDEEEKEEEEDEEDEEDEDEDGDAGRQQLPISKPPVKVIKAGEVDDGDEEDDDEEDENEEDTSVRPAAPTLNPNTSGKDPPKFKTGGPLLDHRKLNPTTNKK